jgi:uncharacterized membrane protein
MELLTGFAMWMASHLKYLFIVLLVFIFLWRASQLPQYYDEYKGVRGFFRFYYRGFLVLTLSVPALIMIMRESNACGFFLLLGPPGLFR